MDGHAGEHQLVGDVVTATCVHRSIRDTSGGHRCLIDSISLSVRQQEVVAIVGPSGCGKTLFLSMLAGFERPSRGDINIWGSAPRAGNPDVGFVFARDSLLPWRTARDNVALSLELQGVPRAERRARAMQALRQVSLESSADLLRAQLSQGMRQRVALARTFVANPKLLLLDEPFAALDAQTRLAMQDLLLTLLDNLQATVVIVTHDLREAITLADRVILLTKGPARIRRELDIPFERPRRVSQLESNPLYQDLYGTLRSELEADASD